MTYKLYRNWTESFFFILCYVYQLGSSLRIRNEFFTRPDDVLVTLKAVQRRVSFVFWVFYKCEDCEKREEYVKGTL